MQLRLMLLSAKLDALESDPADVPVTEGPRGTSKWNVPESLRVRFSIRLCRAGPVARVDHLLLKSAYSICPHVSRANVHKLALGALSM